MLGVDDRIASHRSSDPAPSVVEDPPVKFPGTRPPLVSVLAIPVKPTRRWKKKSEYFISVCILARKWKLE